MRVTVNGSAIDQGLLSNPRITIESNNRGQCKLTWQDPSFVCVQAPEITDHTGMVVWALDAKNIGVVSNAQVEIALACQTAKSGTGDCVFTIYALENPTQPLIRHVETFSIRPSFQNYTAAKRNEKI